MAGEDLRRSDSLRGREVDAALHELNSCVERIRALIPRVHAMIDQRVETPTRRGGLPRIIRAGGPSVFGRRGPAARRAPVVHEPQTISEPQTASEPQTRLDTRVAQSSGRLVVAADLALAGYSREQISERLTSAGGPPVTYALADVFEPGSQ